MSFFDVFKKKPVTLKVTMMGGRGVGKSSVLASVTRNIKNVLSDTKLYMDADGASMLLINNKFDELTKMFDNVKQGIEIPSAGIAGDEDVTTYSFTFGMNETDTKMNVLFRDFPGEYIEREPETVKSFIEESNAILIAIDTPHLMEENGAYNEAKNCCKVITDFITKHLQDSIGRKLILFVPLKCEKYYYARQMSEVAEKVKEAYHDLIKMLKEEHKTDVACAILPIQTLGDVVFSHFGRNQKQKVKVVKKQTTGLLLPEEVIYRYRNSQAHYSPVDCEQPLYFLLSFIAKEYETSRNAPPKNLLEVIKRKLGGMFKLLSDNPEFLLQISRLKRRRKGVNGNNGFTIITGKNLL